jgi:predicted phosphodiesterase
MKLRILSDLHLEFGAWTPPPVEADGVVLAGDIDVSSRGLHWARKHFPRDPIVVIAGNHEFYGRRMEEELERLRDDARKLGIHFLDNESIVIGGTRFLGSTLWTDFKFDGESAEAQARAKRIALGGMNDFQIIRFAERRFHPDDAQTMNRQALDWLGKQLAVPFDGGTVVVTHHLPHEKCISARFRGSTLNPAFASHLPTLVCNPVRLWIHGHTHDSVDFMVDGTRVVCNPRGYAGHELNPAFDPELTVEV